MESKREKTTMKKIFIVFLGILCISMFGSWAIVTSMEDNNDNKNSKASVNSNDYTNTFTNVYGTATTICVHSGCTNYIASSGNTNCCVSHSNKCLNCGKYIDEDAMYCLSCLTESVKSSKKSNGCEYKKSNGEICGAKVGSHAPLCDKHFKELDDVYNSLLGN